MPMTGFIGFLQFSSYLDRQNIILKPKARTLPPPIFGPPPLPPPEEKPPSSSSYTYEYESDTEDESRQTLTLDIPKHKTLQHKGFWSSRVVFNKDQSNKKII